MEGWANTSSVCWVGWLVRLQWPSKNKQILCQLQGWFLWQHCFIFQAE